MLNHKSVGNHKSLGWVVSSSLVLAAVSLGQAAALAQVSGGAQDGKTVAQALAERRQRSGSLREVQPETSVSMYIFSDGNKTIKLRNGKVESVTIDGKEVPAERATADGNDVVISDETGKEIARFAGAGQHIGAGGKAFPGAQAFPGGQSKLRPMEEGELPQEMNRLLDLRRSTPRATGGRIGQASPLTAEAPKVMLGISMSKPSSELAGHFGIKPGTVTLVNFVHKGTPAAEAGLQQYDLLTRIKVGNAAADDVATPEKIRELMRDAKPGDEVEFKVIQRGAEKTLKVKLAAYDETKLTDGPSPESFPGELTIFGPGALGQGAGGAGGGGAFGGVLAPMPGQGGQGGPGGQGGIAAAPGMPPMPRDLNDQKAWREFGDAFRGMGERFKENSGNPFIVLEPLGKGENGAAGDVDMQELMQRLEERLATMEQALRDLKTPGTADKTPGAEKKAPPADAKDAKDAGAKKDKKQGATRGGGGGGAGDGRVISGNIKRVIIGMPQADAI